MGLRRRAGLYRLVRQYRDERGRRRFTLTCTRVDRQGGEMVACTGIDAVDDLGAALDEARRHKHLFCFGGV